MYSFVYSFFSCLFFYLFIYLYKQYLQYFFFFLDGFWYYFSPLNMSASYMSFMNQNIVLLRKIQVVQTKEI